MSRTRIGAHAKSLAAVAALLLAAGASACGGPPTEGNQATGDVAGEVLVSAAASLSDAFAEIAAAFEEAHPAAEVTLNLGGSAALREQILEGAPADVFAPADTDDMDRVVEADGAREPRLFARNRLQIAVPVGNPADVKGLADFADEALLIGLCAEGVPCGDLARRALDSVGVSARVDTNEPDVRALLTRIAAGELDAGIVYVTDVASADGAVEAIDIAEADDAVAAYPIATLSRAPNLSAAEAFVGFVLSDAGREILRRHGFSSP